MALVNPDVVRERQLRSAAKPHCREINRLASERIRKRNPQKAKEWRAANPEKNFANKVAYRARKLRAEGNASGHEIIELLRKQGQKCVECKVRLNREKNLDHITPLSKGGSNHIWNLQWLCPKCNRKKKAKLPLDWARENGRLL